MMSIMKLDITDVRIAKTQIVSNTSLNPTYLPSSATLSIGNDVNSSREEEEDPPPPTR